MKSLFVVLAVLPFAAAERDSYLVQCGTTDSECLNRSTMKFLARTHKGIPELNIKAIDPLIIPFLSTTINDYAYEYRYLTVTGFKNQDISDFRLDLEKKTAIFTAEANITITGDFSVTNPAKSKTFDGSLEFRGSPLTTSFYPTELKRDENGVLHFDVGPETITCKVDTPVLYEYSSNLLDIIETGKDVNEKSDAVRASAFCSIVVEAYKTVIHNIRVATGLFPASAFFKNMDQ